MLRKLHTSTQPQTVSAATEEQAASMGEIASASAVVGGTIVATLLGPF